MILMRSVHCKSFAKLHTLLALYSVQFYEFKMRVLHKSTQCVVSKTKTQKEDDDEFNGADGSITRIIPRMTISQEHSFSTKKRNESTKSNRNGPDVIRFFWKQARTNRECIEFN